jgi:hypothetical protein
MAECPSSPAATADRTNASGAGKWIDNGYGRHHAELDGS